MPPVLPRKRLKPDSPEAEPPRKRTARKPRSRRSKETVFQTLDTPPTIKRTLSETKKLLAEQDDDDSSLSELESSSDEFEDVWINNTSKGEGTQKAQGAEDSTESADEEWEDALGSHHHTRQDHEPAPVISGDIELTLSSVPTPAAFTSKPDGKKGPSKIERQIRNVTHCMHVQFLMFHNLTRNGWIQDTQVQKILVENLTTGCWREIDQYWRDSGISDGQNRVVQVDWRKTGLHEIENRGMWKESGKQGVKIYESPKQKGTRSSTAQVTSPPEYTSTDARKSNRKQRDWGATSDRLEPNQPNLSAGDPLLRLLKYLSTYWKSKFKIIAPSLRKRGYLPPSTLEAEVRAWRENVANAELFGERVEHVQDFRKAARQYKGSRDVGQQLFTALLRGLGIEARMVATLQPVGFGWSQNEEGKAKNLDTLDTVGKVSNASKSGKAIPIEPKAPRQLASEGTPPQTLANRASSWSSDLSSVISISSDSERESRPIKKPPKTCDYAFDLPHPTYWTEAISPLTHTPISVSPLPRTIIASSSSSPDRLAEFYSKGAAADKAKQVFAYVIAFSSDGTAKDVTTRYLPKHQWPGKTKGVRMPVERIPIHDKRGKVKRWEEWDWFKSVMRPYARSHEERRPWDEVEDEGDLVPAQPTKPKDMDEEGGKETLQGYKNSADYVLERHLRREEAIISGAKIVRYFTTGKGDNVKQEPVYRRKDIVVCKTVESWHKEGRAVKEGEQPLKYVPMRAVTVTRKREIEERERVEGGKVQQGLYSKHQTDWIIPDPIVDGKIPRNAFGNIDVYVPTMIPKGAIHIPLKGTAKVCRKLNIDYAEACTGFEFGKQRAVPILTGVVVAAENEDLVIDAWEAEEAEKARTQQNKRERLVLGLWKKFFVGLRLVDRMKREYGEDVELPEKDIVKDQSEKKAEWDTFKDHQDFEGGFLREEPLAAGGSLRDHSVLHYGDQDMAGGFLPASQEESFVHHAELTIDHGEQEGQERISSAEKSLRAPISLHSALQNPVNEEIERYGNDQQNGDQERSYGEGDDEKASMPLSTPRASGNTVLSRTSDRGRGGKRVATSKPRLLAANELDSDSSLTPLSRPSSPTRDSEPTNCSGQSTSPHRRLKRGASNSPPVLSTRAAPKRKAARKSEAQVKSHFFTHGSDAETDATDRSPRKTSAKRGKGRRRGNRRGKPRH